jgi:hypothetical protein
MKTKQLTIAISNKPQHNSWFENASILVSKSEGKQTFAITISLEDGEHRIVTTGIILSWNLDSTKISISALIDTDRYATKLDKQGLQVVDIVGTF